MASPDRFPPVPGSYILFLLMKKPETITIGSLGSWEFPSGYFAYIGSAQGPGGLRGRIRRHLRPIENKRAHWHIDHLTAFAKITHVLWKVSVSNLECSWAQQLAEWGSLLVPRFGSSDCGCPGHLLWLPSHKNHDKDWHTLMKRFGNNIEFVHL